MQTFNQMEQNNIMPLLMSFTNPTPIQEYTPIFNYDDENQISYEMRNVGTRSLRYVATKFKGGGQGSDPKNVIDDEKWV